MINFISIDYYTTFYYQFLLVIVLLTVFHCLVLEINDKRNIVYTNFIGIISLLFTVLYMGLRPLSYVFMDMMMYAHTFQRLQDNNPLTVNDDYAFYKFLEICSKIMTVDFFFFICACFYVIPIYFLSKKWFKEYWFYCFLTLIVSFSFWAYGTNGIRNGIATSLFLLAMTFSNKKPVLILLLLVSCSFHKTMILPSLAFFITLFYNKTEFFIKFWFFAIVLSLLFGNLFVELFSNIGFEDNRIDVYFTDQLDESLTKTGFRWDFLIYSATGVFAGWHYIFKKQFTDNLYAQLFNVYLFVNAFWILVIRANFSNRFAYLSWFMLGIIIIYPLLKEKFYENQNKVIGGVLLIYFSFTYFMNVILAV
jgi:hypothetical protein